MICQVDALGAELSRSTSCLKAATAEHLHLQSVNEDLRREVANLEADISQLTTRLKVDNKQSVETSSKVPSQTIKHVTNENCVLQVHLAELQSQVACEIEQRKGLAEALEMEQSQHKDLQRSFQELKDKNTNLEQQLESMKVDSQIIVNTKDAHLEAQRQEIKAKHMVSRLCKHSRTVDPQARILLECF